MMRREKALCGHAADQGEESSFRLLADLYRNGYYGVPVDLQKQLGGMICIARPSKRVPVKRQKLASPQLNALTGTPLASAARGVILPGANTIGIHNR